MTSSISIDVALMTNVTFDFSSANERFSSKELAHGGLFGEPMAGRSMVRRNLANKRMAGRRSNPIQGNDYRRIR